MLDNLIQGAVGVGTEFKTLFCWALAGVLFAGLIYAVFKGSDKT